MIDSEGVALLIFNGASEYAIVIDDKSHAKSDNPFADVNPDDWFYDDVLFAYSNGLLAGTSVNPPLFSPNMNATRGMIATLIYRMEGSPDVSAENPFSDIAAGAWYANAVKWAAANGIVAGMGNGKFAPDANITRQDFALIIARYTGYKGVTFPESREYAAFTDDKEISDYARTAIETLYKAGIINGRPGNLLDPKGNAACSELASTLRRLLIVINGGEVPITG
ncbi:MAG: S-layer homology domain-containing protein [Clostridiales bacterium]|nr:S-layer homology domain-containing protein [Clostridiales bacterium]